MLEPASVGAGDSGGWLKPGERTLGCIWKLFLEKLSTLEQKRKKKEKKKAVSNLKNMIYKLLTDNGL